MTLHALTDELVREALGDYMRAIAKIAALGVPVPDGAYDPAKHRRFLLEACEDTPGCRDEILVDLRGKPAEVDALIAACLGLV